MKNYYNITILLLLFELSCFNGHAILKREANEADIYEVKEDKDTLEIINPKAKKPTLREIIYYHVIEKPYPGNNEKTEENDFKTEFHDVTRPFTNGHGFQYLKDPDENNSEENKKHLNQEQIDDESEHKIKLRDEHEPKRRIRDETEPKRRIRDETEPKRPIRDETEPKRPIRDETEPKIRDKINLDDLKPDDEMNDRIKDELPNDMITLDEVINDKEDRSIPEKIERMRRRKREIDYSKLPLEPLLPALRMDILPDYIKSILPTEDEFSFNLKSPEFTDRSAEIPLVPSITEEYEIRTEESRNTESYVPKISIRVGGDETHDEQIPIKPQEVPHKIIKKSPMNVDEDIESEIQEVIRKVSDGERQKSSKDPSFYGMDLKGNGGKVWNNLNNQHYEYNVGPDAVNEEMDRSILEKIERMRRRKREIDYSNLNNQHYEYNVGPDAVNEEMDRSILEKIERMRRRKREIDYSKLPPAPPLPAFRMDILPDYIKSILPTEDEFSLSHKSPEFTDRSAEIPLVPSFTEEFEIKGEESRNTESYAPKISIRIGGDETHDEQIAIKPHEIDHKIIKKSPMNVDEDIEAEIREAIQKVTDGDGQEGSKDPPSYGMDLKGNGGKVWNDLNNQHYEYNVGPDAVNEEVHDEQIPTKPHEGNNNEGNKEITNEIADTLNELEHILEDIVPNNNNLHENNNSNEETTENDDIEIIINKNKPKLIVKVKQLDKIEEKSKSKKDFEPTLDPRSLIDDKDGKIEPKSKNPDNSIDIALNILEVLQEIVANANNSDAHNDDTKVKLKDITEPERDRKHHKHKEEIDAEKYKNNEIDDLLNNDKYWEWLKESSQASLNLLMKRVKGLIKEEVSQQIQELITKMMEEQGQRPGKEPEKQDNLETKQPDENDETRTDDKNVKVDIAVEESDVNPQVLSKLKENDKWQWLTNSSQAYLGALMKRINKLIKEEATKQVEHLMKYHMPGADQNKLSENNDNKDNSTASIEIIHGKEESEKNKNENPKEEVNNDKNEIETSKTAKDETEVKVKSHKATEEDKKHTNKHTDTNKKPLLNINAENSYGSSVGNEKVTNIFIFNLNGTDLKNIKPISSDNGMFVFETGNNKPDTSEKPTGKPDTSEKPTGKPDNSNVDSTTDSNKVEITTTTEEAKPVDEEKSNLDSKEDSNKDENTPPTEENKDTSSEDKKDKLTDSSKKESEKVIENDKNKEKSVEKNIKEDQTEKESSKNKDKSAKVTKTESKDETKGDLSKAEEASEGKKDSKDDEKDSKGDEKDSKGDEQDSKGDVEDSKGGEKDSKGDEKDSKGDEKDSKGDEKVKSES